MNPASPSPARQRIIIAQVGSSGTGSALLTLEAEADVGAALSEFGGGEIVAMGTPEEIMRNKRSYTGAYLAQTLARRPERKARKEAAE